MNNLFLYVRLISKNPATSFISELLLHKAIVAQTVNIFQYIFEPKIPFVFKTLATDQDSNHNK
jgi:hypothetical protein